MPKNFETTEFKIMHLKSSDPTLTLWPLNFGMGEISPIPKSVGISSKDRKMLKMDFKIAMTEG